MSLKGKKVLITAGPTWVSIDTVRVISNIATGQTGILLAERLRRSGAKVTLLLGPAESCCLNKKIKLIRFQFFSELKNLILKELKIKKYDIVIHSAAVSDYKPKTIFRQKIESGKKSLRLNLVPTVKIVDLIRRADRFVYLVGFKFEPDATKDLLIRKARYLMRSSNSDLAVANTINQNRYLAYIVNQDKIYGPIRSKKGLSKKLIKILVRNSKTIR